jgi:preprotein translocase subunit YajC
MPGLFADLPLLFAQNGAAAQGGGSAFAQLLPFLPVLVLFYFLIIRPHQQQERKRRTMIDALKKNDRVLTQAGIYGTVVSINSEADKVVLRVDDDRGVKLEFSRASIVRVVTPESEKAKDKAAELA